MNKALMPFVLTTCVLASHAAHAIVIDGNLADWGLKQTGQVSDWTPDSAIVPNVHQFTVEDQTGGAGVRLFPGWGGQNYDAEALYVSLDSDFLYLALITGLSPDTPDNPAANSYGPGDFAIDFGMDGSFEFGIQTTGPNAGKVYLVSSWGYGLWDINGNHNPANPDKSHPTSMVAGDQVGEGALIYTSTPFTNMGAHAADKHYAIEAAIPLSSFSGYSGKFDVHWTMNCANDAIRADPELTVPEPGTLALFPLGMLGLAAMRRKKSPQ